MRDGAYRLFEIVTWPAVVWGVIELCLRGATGYGAGLLDSLLITSAGVGALTACRLRRAALAGRPARV